MTRAAFALLLLAHLASPALADSTDDFCKNVRPSTYGVFYAVCSDPKLRALARQLAETNARIEPLFQQNVAAGEAEWLRSYAARACGITSDAFPASPLAPDIKNCVVRAVEARVAYLCASYARCVPGPSLEERLASLRPGQTTETQAIAVLGAPLDGAPVPEGELVARIFGSKAVAVLFGHDGKMIAVSVDTLGAAPGRR